MCLETLFIQQYILEKFTPFPASECAFQVNYIDEKSDNDTKITSSPNAQRKCPQLSYPFARSPLISAPIKSVESLVAPATLQKGVKELTFDLTEMDTSTVDYQPGDTIGILPRNSPFAVDRICEALQIRDKIHDFCNLISITEKKKGSQSMKLISHIPTLFTPYELVSDCLDFHAVPKKKFLRRLADRCSNKEEQKFLGCLSSKEGSLHYNLLFLQMGLKLLELLEACPSCLPTLADLIEFLPRLLPRPYSIANSNLTADKELKIIYSSMPQQAGITTGMLDELSEALTASPKVDIFFRAPTQFRYTSSDVCCSQILIGIGVGVAPFFGLLQYKQEVVNANSNTNSIGQTWLFAGARFESAVLHKTRIEGWQKSGVLDKYFECLSKETEAMYNYVQDAIAANAKDFVKFLMHSDTSIYICGGAQLAKTIKSTLRKCLMEQLIAEESQADEVIRNFQLNGKYREDIWI